MKNIAEQKKDNVAGIKVTPEMKSKLLECEMEIKEGRARLAAGWVVVASACIKIIDQQLYLAAGYEKFDDYITEVHNITPGYIYSMVKAYREFGNKLSNLPLRRIIALVSCPDGAKKEVVNNSSSVEKLKSMPGHQFKEYVEEKKGGKDSVLKAVSDNGNGGETAQTQEENKKNISDPYKEFMAERKKEKSMDKMMDRVEARGEAEEITIASLVSELQAIMGAILKHTHKNMHWLPVSSAIVPDKNGIDRLGQLFTAILYPAQCVILCEGILAKAASEIERQKAIEDKDNPDEDHGLPEELAVSVEGIKKAWNKIDRLL
ncbi:MAG: hypothetical protein HZB80_08650 [Deltaproteobacteria bacterium]|nr:hypothetical protein [Deltaproteobacteria bacterium]